MPASPVHHTGIDSTSAWDGPAAVKAFDKKAGDMVKFYAWYDKGETNPDADGTDKADGWGPHHDVDAKGIPGDANVKGFEAAMAALNGAHGTTSRIPAGDRQGVHDHLAAHYKNAGVATKDIPDLAARSHDHLHGETRDAYSPVAYTPDDDDVVECLVCGCDNAPEASYCDQCGVDLSDEPGADMTVPVDLDGLSRSKALAGETRADSPVCPSCSKTNNPDASFCDKCGTKLVDNPAVTVQKGDDSGVPLPGQSPDDEGDPPKTDPAWPYSGGHPVAVDEQYGEGGTPVDPPYTPPAKPTGTDPLQDAVSRSRPPRSNLTRARVGGVELRAAAAGTDDEPGVATGSLMFGHFAVFNEWYAVDSYFEGTFLESFKKGAFTQTFKDDAASIRSIYNHGWDEQLGMKPLGPVQTLREDDVGAYYEVPLLDTHYNRDYVLPALQGRLITGEKVGSQLGASFRFDAIEEQWNTKPTPSDVNPEGLPERTITRAKVLEFGPGMFAISPTATAGVRSTTDIWFDHLRKDPRFTARATERFGVTVVEKLLATKPPDRRTRRGPAAPARTATEPPDGRAKRVDQLQRRARAALLET
jgi:hypothetical protein